MRLHNFTIIVLLLLGNFAYAQDGFEVDTTKRVITLSDFGSSQSLKFKIQLSKHTSVKIITFRDGQPQVRIIKKDTIFTQLIENTEYIKIFHRNKIVFRFCQVFFKHKNPEQKLPNPKSRVTRVNATSGSGGSTTSTTVEST
jgi:hypothetical protein